MSITLSITGITSTISTFYSPALQLDDDYECGLLYLSTFNSIPNIDNRNNKLYFGIGEHIEIPEGAYELQDISDYIQSKMKDGSFHLQCNNNTLKTSILCSKDIDFKKNDSIGFLLGFSKRILKANILHESDHPVNILSTTVVRVECNIISRSYINGEIAHILHEFPPAVPPGYRIIEIPKNVIYFPINQKSVSCINIRLLDGNNKLINLRGEEIQLYLHLKKR